VTLALDSSIAIEIIRAKQGVSARGYLQAALSAGQPVWISSVVVQELMTGALKSIDPTRSLERVDRFLTRLTIAEFTAEDAISSARVRAELEMRGAKIGALDTLIAGQALARDWTLATSDLDFARVDGLTIVDWTRSDQPINRLDKLAELLRRLETEE
jgi:tRNA(fMet)-specific endonuclease VapC